MFNIESNDSMDQYIEDDDIMHEFIDTYIESTKFKQDANLLVITFEHLLKLKYCTNDRNYNGWTTSVKHSLVKLYNSICDDKHIKLGAFVDDDKYGRYFNDESVIQKYYNDSIKKYKDLTKTYSDLKEGLQYIPSDCPWKFSELMNSLYINDDNEIVPDIDNLLSYLPDMD